MKYSVYLPGKKEVVLNIDKATVIEENEWRGERIYFDRGSPSGYNVIANDASVAGRVKVYVGATCDLIKDGLLKDALVRVEVRCNHKNTIPGIGFDFCKDCKRWFVSDLEWKKEQDLIKAEKAEEAKRKRKAAREYKKRLKSLKK